METIADPQHLIKVIKPLVFLSLTLGAVHDVSFEGAAKLVSRRSLAAAVAGPYDPEKLLQRIQRDLTGEQLLQLTSPHKLFKDAPVGGDVGEEAQEAGPVRWTQEQLVSAHLCEGGEVGGGLFHHRQPAGFIIQRQGCFAIQSVEKFVKNPKKGW